MKDEYQFILHPSSFILICFGGRGMHKVGILTGGGDCPGLNAVIRAVVRKIDNAGGTCLGLLEGWRGLLEEKIWPLNVLETDDIIALGGDDTLGVASRLFTEHQLPMVGVPKTIDNDLSATDFTFGFDTAINIVMEAVDRLRTTAESHRRIMVIETMGRKAGWIACLSGIAVAADYILVPEVPVDLDHMCGVLQRRRAEGKLYGLVVVSEGAQLSAGSVVTADASIDEFGHEKLGGIGQNVAELIDKRLQIETRHVTLGHLQRGGPP